MVSALPHLTLRHQAEVIIGSAPRGITEKASYISPILGDVLKYLQKSLRGVLNIYRRDCDFRPVIALKDCFVGFRPGALDSQRVGLAQLMLARESKRQGRVQTVTCRARSNPRRGDWLAAAAVKHV